mgnify:CR=1 FL=1
MTVRGIAHGRTLGKANSGIVVSGAQHVSDALWSARSLDHDGSASICERKDHVGFQPRLATAQDQSVDELERNHGSPHTIDVYGQGLAVPADFEATAVEVYASHPQPTKKKRPLSGCTPVPRVTGPIRRRHPVEVRDVQFLRANTDRRIKITLPGPFTMSMQAHDEHYGDEEAFAMAYAEVVAEEARDLAAAGADVIQLDEPWLQARPEQAKRYGVKAINRALQDVPGTTVVHLCFGYAALVSDKPSGYSFLPQLADSTATQISIEAAQPRLDLGMLSDLSNKTIMLGVLDLGTTEVETAETVAARLREGLRHVPAERLVAAPDCGMKYLPRARAFAKLKALAEGAAIVRRELAG